MWTGDRQLKILYSSRLFSTYAVFRRRQIPWLDVWLLTCYKGSCAMELVTIEKRSCKFSD